MEEERRGATARVMCDSAERSGETLGIAAG